MFTELIIHDLVLTVGLALIQIANRSTLSAFTSKELTFAINRNCYLSCILTLVILFLFYGLVFLDQGRIQRQ